MPLPLRPLACLALVHAAACGPPPVAAEDAVDALAAVQGLYASSVLAAAKGRKPGKSFGDEEVACEDGGTALVTLIYTLADEVPVSSEGFLDLTGCTVGGLSVSGSVEDRIDYDSEREELTGDVVFTGAIDGSCTLDVVVKNGNPKGTACGHDLQALEAAEQAEE